MNKKVADFLYSYLIYSYFQEINDTKMRELSIIAFSQPFDKLLINFLIYQEAFYYKDQQNH